MQQSQTPAAGEEEERIPIMQHLLENPFLLLFLGVAIPTVFYIIWGSHGNRDACPMRQVAARHPTRE